LIAEIRSGRRQPGERVPSVRELASQRGPDGREHGQSVAQGALETLVQEGWATSAVGSGTYVVEILPDVKPSLEERLAQVEADVAEIKSRLDLW
jgi:DNA-binding GntR family transcriptional regulator